MNIPVNIPNISEDDISSLLQTVHDGWISSAGPAVQEFENRWAAKCGRKYGIAVANGTAALELSIRALKLGPGDEVIIPDFTIISCANAVALVGAIPIFVDSGFNSYCPDLDAIERAITKRTKAIMLVHIYGHSPDVEGILKLAQKYGLKIIEDAAEMHGGEYRFSTGEWKKAGSFGDCSTFSFFVNKLITTGEGGMILTDDLAIAEELRLLRNLYFKVPRYVHEKVGFNYRITSMQAALGIPQIERLDKILRRKAQIHYRYFEALKNVFEYCEILPISVNTKSSYWVVPVLFKSARLKVNIQGYLAEKGIETRDFFYPMHLQPNLQEFAEHQKSKFERSTELYSRGMYLPSGVGTANEQIDTVAAEIINGLSISQMKLHD